MRFIARDFFIPRVLLVSFKPHGHVNRDTSRPLLRGHQALDTLSLASFQEHDEGKIRYEIEGDDRSWTSNL